MVRVTGYKEEIKEEDVAAYRSPERDDVDEGDKQVPSGSRVDPRMPVADSEDGDERFDSIKGGSELITVDQPD